MPLQVTGDQGKNRTISFVTIRTMMNICNNEMEVYPTNDIAAVFDSFGVLEHILSYASPKDLARCTEVNQRWKEAGRSDVLWKFACASLWKDRKGMFGCLPKDTNEEMPLFWRSSLSDAVINHLTVRQIRGLFNHFLLHQQKQQLKTCLEKSEMIRLVRTYAEELQFEGEVRYSDLWFGSFASSMLDAQRESITKEELCSPYGFDTFFKVLEEEVWDSNDLAQLIPYDGHSGIMLYQHSVCYFDPNNDEFVMELKDGEAHHPMNFQWQWNHNLVQVGPYPHLVITRLPDWGWKLENVHVVMLFRDSRSEYSSRR